MKLARQGGRGPREVLASAGAPGVNEMETDGGRENGMSNGHG